MYVLGMILVGLGIVLLVMAGFALLSGAPIIAGLICVACVPVPMLIIGINLVRRAEDRAKAAGKVQNLGPSTTQAASTPLSIRERFGSFDLNQLNWIGWLLLLGTIMFALVPIALVKSVVSDEWLRQNVNPNSKKIIGFVVLISMVGVFVITRWILERFGISIYRQNQCNDSDDISE